MITTHQSYHRGCGFVESVFFRQGKTLICLWGGPTVEQYLISKGYAYEKDEDDLITILEGEQFWF